MKQSAAMGLVLFVGIAACGAAWAFLPTMQPSLRRVESAATVPLERARRLLHQYDARLPYQAAVLEQLAESGVSSDKPDELSDEALDDYQQIHERLWSAFQPMQWGDHPSPARANYGALEQQMQSGTGDRARYLRENQALLREALTAVDEALAISRGEVSGRDLAEAHRVRATILYYSGLAESIRASIERQRVAPYRSTLESLCDEASTLAGSVSLIAASGVDDDLAAARREIARAQTEVDGQRQVVAGLDRSIADRRQRVASFQTERDRAKQEMDLLSERGVDFSRAEGSSSYATAYLEAARRYRQADRQVQYLTTGFYPHAEIDASGDFLTGRYVENGSPFNLTIETGLNHLENEHVIAAKVLVERERVLDEWRAALARLEELRSSFARQEEAANSRLVALRQEAEDTLAALEEAEESALELEEAALGNFDRAARSARESATAAGRWISDAQQRTQHIASQNQDRSAFKPRTDDRWIGAFALAQSADAHLARAWVYYDQFIAASESAVAFERTSATLHLGQDQIAVQREGATAARDAGVEAVKLAMTDLERAHRDGEGHWTFVAQAGSTQYLLALFGDGSYVADTIAAYRKAVENREDTPAARSIVARLRSLEARR